MKPITALSMLLSFVLILPACNKKSERVEEEIKKYELAIQAKINEVDQKISELQVRTEANLDSGDVQVELQNQIAELERQKYTLGEKLHHVWTATEDNWEQLKNDIDEQLARVDELLNKEIQITLSSE